MSVRLNQADREYLERFVGRERKPTGRQKAQALLGLAEGKSLDAVAMQVGIAKVDLMDLVDRFVERGLAGVGFKPSRGQKNGPRRSADRATIEATSGICGGAARIAGTRIPVWQLIEAREMGATEAQILLDYPGLHARNLVNAWDYAKEHSDEIAAEIHRNGVA